MIGVDVLALDQPGRRAEGIASFVRGTIRRPLALLGLLIVVFITLLAVLAPWISPHKPSELLDAPNLAAPSGSYLLGTDSLGRDILTRVLHGARVSLAISVGSVFIASLVGGLIGLVSGFTLGWLDLTVQRVMDGLMSIPTLVLAVVVGVTVGSSVKSVVIAVAVAFIPQVQRVVRSAVIALRGAPFVQAATAGGCRPIRVLFVHLAPQIVAPLLVIVTALLGQAIIIESAISFVGAGPQPPTATWGGMLSEGLERHPSRAVWLVLFPGLAIFLTVLGFNLLGDAVRDRLDPRRSR